MSYGEIELFRSSQQCEYDSETVKCLLNDADHLVSLATQLRNAVAGRKSAADVVLHCLISDGSRWPCLGTRLDPAAVALMVDVATGRFVPQCDIEQAQKSS